MINKGLVPYIQSYVQQGYDRASIVRYMAAYGYQQRDIIDTYDYVHAPQRKFPAFILLLGVVLIALIAVGAFIMFKPQAPQKSFYAVASLARTDFPSDQQVALSYSLSLVGTDANKETLLNERILDSKGDVVFAGNEVLTVRQLTAKMIRLRSGIPPGQYTLELSIQHDGKTAEKTLQFVIREPTAIVDACGNGVQDAGEQAIDCGGDCLPCTPEQTIIPCTFSCDDQNACTEDSCNPSANQCVHQQIVPCCGNEVCESSESSKTCARDCAPPQDLTPYEIIERAALIASQDAEQAAQMCRSLPEEEDESACYYRIARVVQRSTLCELVQGSLQSSCYMDFAMQGDYTVCEKIKNKYLRDSCENLAQLQQAL